MDGLLGYSCVLAISDSGSNVQPYVLGDTFMRNFYVTFDFKGKQVDFAVSSNAPSGVSLYYKLSGWEIFGIVAGCIAFVVVVGLIVRCIIKKRNSRAVQIGGSSTNIYKQKSLTLDGEDSNSGLL